MDEFFSKLKKQCEVQLPFVAYRFSAAAEVKALLQKDKKLHEIKDYAESGFVFAPFDAEKPACYIPSEASEAITAEVDFSKLKNEERSVEFASKVTENDENRHKKLVSEGIEAINAENFQKVVLSRKETVEIGEQNPIFIFEKLLRKYPTAFVYVYSHPEIGLWLGATPETLLKVERNRFQTMSLAGTQKFNGTTDVAWGEKEKEEQQIVTFSILKNLEEAGISEIKTSEAYTTQAGNLLHIRTDIEGKISGTKNSVKDVVSALHPTPAVCGLPKEAAKFFILKNEGYDREYYTGFLGELNLKTERKRNSNRRNQENQAYGSISKKTSLFVNLRCMKIEDSTAQIFVGGGITKDSDPAAEWEETRNKAGTIKAVLSV